MRQIHFIGGFDCFMDISFGKISEGKEERYFIRIFDSNTKNYNCISFEKRVLEEISNSLTKELSKKGK